VGKRQMCSYRQVIYAFKLMAKRGYDRPYLSAQFTGLSERMEGQADTLIDWLENLTQTECSFLIQKLRQEGQ